MCAKYHGFELDELEYLVFQYTLDQIVWKSNQVMDNLMLVLEDLENFNLSIDLGSALAQYNSFCKGCLRDYSTFLDQVNANITTQIGVGYQFVRA